MRFSSRRAVRTILLVKVEKQALQTFLYFWYGTLALLQAHTFSLNWNQIVLWSARTAEILFDTEAEYIAPVPHSTITSSSKRLCMSTFNEFNDIWFKGGANEPRFSWWNFTWDQKYTHKVEQLRSRIEFPPRTFHQRATRIVGTKAWTEQSRQDGPFHSYGSIPPTWCLCLW